MATATPDKIPDTDENRDTAARVAAAALRKRIMLKVTVQSPTRVDIKKIGQDRYRVNAWAETGQTSEGGLFKPQQIVQSFIHFD